MAKPGFKVVTIKTATFNKVTEISHILSKSVPDTILYLAEEYLKTGREKTPLVT